MANINSLNIYQHVNYNHQDYLIYLLYSYNKLKTEKLKSFIQEINKKFPKEFLLNKKKFEY